MYRDLEQYPRSRLLDGRECFDGGRNDWYQKELQHLGYATAYVASVSGLQHCYHHWSTHPLLMACALHGTHHEEPSSPSVHTTHHHQNQLPQMVRLMSTLGCPGSIIKDLGHPRRDLGLRYVPRSGNGCESSMTQVRIRNDLGLS